MKTRHIFANVRPAANHPSFLLVQEMIPRLNHMNVVSVRQKHFILWKNISLVTHSDFVIVLYVIKDFHGQVT
jgi:uncharacterized protein YbcV (DUF1398 family)